MCFVLFSCDSEYIFFRWNLSGNVGFIHLFITAPNELDNWLLFFLGILWNTRDIRRWKSMSSLDNFLLLMDLVSCFHFFESLPKTALSTFLPRIVFQTNWSVPSPSPCLKLFWKNDVVISYEKLRSHCFFVSFLHFNRCHSPCLVNFQHQEMMQTSTLYAFFLIKEKYLEFWLITVIPLHLFYMCFHCIAVGLSLHTYFTNEPPSTTTETWQPMSIF